MNRNLVKFLGVIVAIEVGKMDVVEAIKKECFRRRLSNKTIKTYVFWNKKFFSFCKKDHKEITKKDVKEFIDCLSERDVSANTLNVALNSIKFMLDWVLYKRWRLNIKYSKKPKKLPSILSREEVIRLISSTKNHKHRIIMALMYSAGLRVNELVNLMVRDLEIKDSYGWVRHGKGNKDRVFIIAERLKEDIIKFIEENKLSYNNYIFAGQNSNHLSTQTIFQIVKKAAKDAKIKKNVHPHTLRHSFGTHIIENGYSLQSLQGLLGHSSPETSMVYIHTALPKMIKIKSPYDDLNA